MIFCPLKNCNPYEIPENDLKAFNAAAPCTRSSVLCAMLAIPRTVSAIPIQGKALGRGWAGGTIYNI